MIGLGLSQVVEPRLGDRARAKTGGGAKARQ